MELNPIQNSKYTGENRCMPCTAVNSVIAVALSTMISYAVYATTRPEFAVGTFISTNLVFGIAIWLQGYLIPGTPELTKQYMPRWMLSLFGKSPASVQDFVGEGLGDFDVEEFLLSQNVLEPCEQIDDLCVTDDFKSIWDTEIAKVPETITSQEILSTFRLAPSEQEVQRQGDSMVLTTDGGLQLKWPSKTAMQVDFAGVRALSGYISGWKELGQLQQSQATAGLRIFLETCPDGGDAEFNQEVVESCCSTHDVVSVVCAKNGDRLFEQRVS